MTWGPERERKRGEKWALIGSDVKIALHDNRISPAATSEKKIAPSPGRSRRRIDWAGRDHS